MLNSFGWSAPGRRGRAGISMSRLSSKVLMLSGKVLICPFLRTAHSRSTSWAHWHRRSSIASRSAWRPSPGSGATRPAALITLRFYPRAADLVPGAQAADQPPRGRPAGGPARRGGARRAGDAPSTAARGICVLTEQGERSPPLSSPSGGGSSSRHCRPWTRTPAGRMSATLSTMLEALTDDLLTSEFMCRMCDELACPDDRCPVERAEPAPTDRRGSGYGVR